MLGNVPFLYVEVTARATCLCLVTERINSREVEAAGGGQQGCENKGFRRPLITLDCTWVTSPMRRCQYLYQVM